MNRKKLCKMGALLMAVFTLVIAGCTAPGQTTGTAVTFTSPEKAVEYFAKCIGEGDFSGAINAFGAEKRAESFRFVQSAQRLSSIQPMSQLPSEYKGYEDLNKISFMSTASNQIKGLTFSILLPEKYSSVANFMPYISVDADGIKVAAEEITEALNTDKLKGFQFVRLDLAKPELQNAEIYKTNIEKRKQVYGFDDFKEYFVLYKLNSQHYMGGVSLFQFSVNWYIEGLVSSLGGTTAYGTVMPVEKQQYEDFIKNDNQ